MAQSLTTGKTRRNVLAGLAAGAVLTTLAPFEAAADDRVEKASQKLSKSFSGVVRAERDGRLVFERTFGFADYETRTAMRSDLRFRIGSVSKTFTAELLDTLMHSRTYRSRPVRGRHSAGIPEPQIRAGQPVDCAHVRAWRL